MWRPRVSSGMLSISSLACSACSVFVALVAFALQAMADLTCSGSEWSVGECMWSQPNDSCAGHAFDTVVYCTALDEAGALQGAVRLISDDGSPSIDGQGRPEINMGGIWLAICNSGLSPGTAAVICKSMGFSGATGNAKCSGCLACFVP